MTLRGQSTATVKVTGTFTATLVCEASTDGSNFDSLFMYPVAGVNGAAPSSASAVGSWVVSVSGYNVFRVRVSSFTSGAAVTSIVASQGTPFAPAVSSLGVPKVDIGTSNGSALGTLAAFGTSPGAVVALNANVSTFVGTTAQVAAAAGIPKVGISGATGVTMDAANNAALPTNSIPVMGRALSTNPTLATTGNTSFINTDLAGKIVTTPVAPRALIGKTATTVSVTTATAIVVAQGAGVFADITELIITTAGAAAQTITISDGTVSWVINYPNATLAPGQPFIAVFNPPLPAATANTAWNATQSVATACNYLVVFAQRTA
jgi:hypothetical protein